MRKWGSKGETVRKIQVRFMSGAKMSDESLSNDDKYPKECNETNEATSGDKTSKSVTKTVEN